MTVYRLYYGRTVVASVRSEVSLSEREVQAKAIEALRRHPEVNTAKDMTPVETEIAIRHAEVQAA